MLCVGVCVWVWLSPIPLLISYGISASFLKQTSEAEEGADGAGRRGKEGTKDGQATE